MHRTWILAILALGAGIGATIEIASAQLTPNPQRLRFRLVGDEPIAGPDGASTVTKAKVLVFRDMQRGECYVTFILPEGASTVAQGDCPLPPPRH